MIRLRPTTPADLDFVLALEHHPDQKPFIGQWTREQHLEAMGRSDREHWIIERADDSVPQGYLIAYDVRAAGYGVYIKRIAIAEKSQGVGREALREFLAHAFRDQHAKSVCLAVRHHNARAQRAYQAVGFVEQSLSTDEWREFRVKVDPVGDDCLVMRVSTSTFAQPPPSNCGGSHGDSLAGRSTRGSDLPQATRLHRGRHPDSRARHRRQHRHLHPR